MCSILTGCSRQDAQSTSAPVAGQTSSAEAVPQGNDAAVASQTTTASPATAKAGRRRDEVWVDEKGQKWFGNVPMDAFFDNPYEIASSQETLNVGASPEPSTASAPAPMPTPVPDPASVTTEPEPAAPATPADSWSSLISAATIDEEVKSIRNFLNENVHSVGTFNSSMLMIPPKAAALGAIAGIVMEHPESLPWKEDAKYIRDLAKKMNSAALQRGAKDQKRIEELYDAVDATLSRSKPAGLEEPPESDSFAEVSEMRLLMMRMEEAEKKLKTEAGTESAMGSKKDMILHEASMMSVMAKIVTMPGYGYHDDPKFTGYAGEVVKAAQEVKAAAESGAFADYEAAMTRISTTCSNCHSDYKND